MKKLFLISLLMLPVIAFGKNNKEGVDEHPEIVFDEIQLVSGSFEPFTRQAMAFLDIDYSNVTFVRHSKKEIKEVYGSVNDYYAKFSDKKIEDWEDLKQKLYNGFVIMFNKKSKGLKVTDSKEETTLTFKIDVNQLDFGSVGEYFLPTFKSKRWGGAIIDGFVTISDNATGEELCKLALIQLRGQNFYTGGDAFRLSNLFLYMPWRLLKEVKKASNKK